MKNARVPSSRFAFTLVEFIAALVVVSVIGLFGAMTLQRAGAANTQVAARAAVYADASALMDRLIRKVQSTPLRTADTVPAFAGFTVTSLTWDDGSALAYNANGQRVTLIDVPAGDSTSVTAPILADSLTSFTMAAYDQSNVNLLTSLGVTSLTATQGGTIRRVEIQFTMTRQGQSVTLRSRAFPRCALARAGS
ncbi:MAG: hypothetical protein QM783_20175 [Phycisphaerales bacterium]